MRKNNSLNDNTFKRGQVYYADFGMDRLQIKPVLIIQNDVGNAAAKNVIVVLLEKATDKDRLVINVGSTKLTITNKLDTISKEKIYRVAAMANKSGIPKPNAVLTEEQLAILDEELLETVGITNDNFKKNAFIHRGDLYFSVGFKNLVFDDSEEKGDRLCLVLNEDKNDKNNVVVALLTSSPKKANREYFPTHVKLNVEKDKVSTIMLEHLRTIPKDYLNKTDLIYHLSMAETKEVNDKLRVSLAL